VADVVTFALSSTRADDVIVVRVCGELDMGTTQALWSHVSGWIERGHRQFLLDCTEPTFVDCCGLSALLRCSRAARLHGGSMQLCHVSTAVLRLLAITGLAQLLVSEGEIPELKSGGEAATPTSATGR
jgi:anti-anti-sigma factor